VIHSFSDSDSLRKYISKPHHQDVPNQVKAEIVSDFETSRISASKFTIDEVVSCDALKHQYTGRCAYCNGVSLALTHIVKTRTDRFFVCRNCGKEIMEKMQPTKTFELGTLQDKIHATIEVLDDMEHDKGVAKREELIARLERERGIPHGEAERIIGMLIREGTIYEPRHGYLKKT